jgi:hypothetical protein
MSGAKLWDHGRMEHMLYRIQSSSSSSGRGIASAWYFKSAIYSQPQNGDESPSSIPLRIA